MPWSELNKRYERQCGPKSFGPEVGRTSWRSAAPAQEALVALFEELEAVSQVSFACRSSRNLPQAHSDFRSSAFMQGVKEISCNSRKGFRPIVDNE